MVDVARRAVKSQLRHEVDFEAVAMTGADAGAELLEGVTEYVRYA